MVDFVHILESSLDLTFGGMLLKLLDKTCKTNCSNNQQVQTIVNDSDSDSEHEVSDNVSEITHLPDYDQPNNNVMYSNGSYHQEVS